MLDKNNIRIQAGDIVRIEGAYFKTNNGFFYLEEDGTNPSYSSDDTCLTLHKIGKTGKISAAKYSTAFFPPFNCTSDHFKNAKADNHDKKNATIEIVHSVKNHEVIEAFREKARKYKEQEKYYSDRGYDWDKCVKQYHESFLWHSRVADRMAKTALA